MHRESPNNQLTKCKPESNSTSSSSSAANELYFQPTRLIPSPILPTQFSQLQQQQQQQQQHASLLPPSSAFLSQQQQQQLPPQINPYISREEPSYYYPNFHLHEIPPITSLQLPPAHPPTPIHSYYHPYINPQQQIQQQSQIKPRQKRQSRKIFPPGVSKNGRKMLISREEMMSRLDEMMKQKTSTTPTDDQSATESETVSIPSPIQYSFSSITTTCNSSNSSNSSSSGSCASIPSIAESTTTSSNGSSTALLAVNRSQDEASRSSRSSSCSHFATSSDENSNSSSNSVPSHTPHSDSLSKMRLRFILNNNQDPIMEENKR